MEPETLQRSGTLKIKDGCTMLGVGEVVSVSCVKL